MFGSILGHHADEGRTADARLAGDRGVGMTRKEKLYGMVAAEGVEFERPAVLIVGALHGDGSSCLRAFDNHVTLELCKGEEYVGDDFSNGRIVNLSHVEYVDLDALAEELFDKRTPLRCGAGETVELRHHESVAFAQLLHELVKLGAVHRLARVLLLNDDITACSFQLFPLFG